MSAANLISILIIPKHYLIYFPPPQKKVLKCAISRQAKASKLPLVLWLNEIVRHQRYLVGSNDYPRPEKK